MSVRDAHVRITRDRSGRTTKCVVVEPTSEGQSREIELPITGFSIDSLATDPGSAAIHVHAHRIRFDEEAYSE